MANEIAPLTNKQQAFLDALRLPEIMDVPVRQRFRWAATQAGYSDKTSMTLITKGITNEITAVAERILMEASVEAAFTLVDTLHGNNIDPVTSKYRMDAAHGILDRAVPKREQAVKQQGPLVQILLPAKDAKEIKIIDG